MIPGILIDKKGNIVRVRFCHSDELLAELNSVMINPQKQCGKCLRILDRSSEFHLRRASPDGKQSMCKSCVKFATQQYRLTHVEEIHVTYRRWYDRTVEQRRVKNHAYYLNNKERFREYSAKYYKRTRIPLHSEPCDKPGECPIHPNG